jgi:Cd2+/Zn2+-exporting ATPase
VEEIAGMGVRAVVDGQVVLAGNARLLESAGIAVTPVEAGGALVHVAIGGRYAGYLVVSDTLRTEAARAVHGLRTLGVTTIGMLSGDRAGNAETVASSLGLDVWEGDLLPGDKLRSFERERDRIGGVTVFVGDGLNDAPLLAAADVGLAMGGLGADAAVEAADGVLLGDDPSSVADVVAIARRTRTIVWQNITFALGVKALVLLMGAWGMATMWEAVFADVGVALLATLNASRVLMGR